MQFEFEKSTGKKCVSCAKTMDSGEITFGSGWPDGSFLFRHVDCAEASQAKTCTASGLEKVKGWSSLSTSQQTEVRNGLEKASQGKGSKKDNKSAAKRKSTDSATEKPKAAKMDKKEKDSKKEKKGKVEGEPKKPLSAYVLFSSAKREEVTANNPDAAPKDILSLLGAAWKAITAEEKAEFEQKAKEDKERYRVQLEEFEEKGTYTKTEAEIEQDKVRSQKEQASKEKSKAKSASKKKQEEKADEEDNKDEEEKELEQPGKEDEEEAIEEDD